MGAVQRKRLVDGRHLVVSTQRQNSLPVPKINGKCSTNALRTEQIKAWKKKAEERRAKAIAEIKSCFQDGLPGFTAKDRKSTRAIVDALIRRGYVTVYKDYDSLVPLLFALAKEEHSVVVLPDKSKKGGPRQKKKG